MGCHQNDMPRELQDDTGEVHFVPAPCQVACPIGTDAPSYLAYIWEGDLAGAFEAITATNPFSSICGRVCDAPCEPACRRADSDGPIAIRNLKRFVMDKLGKSFQFPPVPVTQKETVGIVGAGPAGMTAAQGLAEAGYEVHIYEMSDRLGGMMVWGIPAFRLPPGIIEEDINRILNYCPGIKTHLNCALGKDISLEELKARHDAVLLTLGAWWGKKMNIPGEEDKRVMDGVGFLREVNAGGRPVMPETVVVVGGGDVAMDACRVARRLPGCKEVKVVYRRGPDEIPARRDELEGAIKEGIEFTHYTQPVEVVDRGDELALRCVLTKLGDPGEDGRRVPVVVEGSEHDIACGMVIAAVGQKTSCAELAGLGMMAGEKVQTRFETMRTGEEKVFAAGDGAFGPSTIVQAMYHGHRGAYYVKAFLQGNKHPAQYRTPFRTRRVPVSQDPEWEIINRQEQPFHGLGEKPVAFPEIESTYTLETAKNEAARCFRCDAENGTYEYSIQNREDIFTMARTEASDKDHRRAMLQKRLATRENPFPESRAATIDDICFLPANLSRLVIDPYREACKTKTELASGLTLAAPFLVAGFDQAPASVRQGIAGALRAIGCVYLGRVPLDDRVGWFQLLNPEEGEPDDRAAGVIYDVGNAFSPFQAARIRPDQLLGLAARAGAMEKAIPFALDQKMEVFILDATEGLGRARAEMNGAVDLSVMPAAIKALRRLKREGDIHLIYFGGVRSGTDAAKAIAVGCSVAVLGTAMGLAVGGQLSEADGVIFSADLSAQDCQRAAESFLKACTSEVSMMARCTGKTNIHSLEPEDLRSITLATAKASGIPLIGTSG